MAVTPAAIDLVSSCLLKIVGLRLMVDPPLHSGFLVDASMRSGHKGPLRGTEELAREELRSR